MYRLLIATENQTVSDMIAAMQGWEKLGFKPPHMRAAADAAVACMGRHHIDAVAMDDAPAFQAFRSWLDEHYPDLPIFQLASGAQEQTQRLQEVSRLLDLLHADDSNDDHGIAFNMQQQRARFMKKLLSGLVKGESELKRQLDLYRVRIPLDVPCLLAKMEIGNVDDFLNERWHYGSDRLEIALRNFFGTSCSRMQLHVAVATPQEVRVLCCPASAAVSAGEEAARAYICETVAQIEKYLGLHLNIISMLRVSGLGELCA